MRENLSAPAENVPLVAIGVVRSAHTEPETTPIQAALNRAGRGTIEIAGPYRDGLAGLDGGGWFDEVAIGDGSTPANLGPPSP